VSETRRVASLAEVPAGQLKLVELDGTRIVLARVGDAVYACGDTCSHRGARWAKAN
jgi:nitrite reductase/ring-hydroxylating ferredoxin subunit